MRLQIYNKTGLIKLPPVDFLDTTKTTEPRGDRGGLQCHCRKMEVITDEETTITETLGEDHGHHKQRNSCEVVFHEQMMVMIMGRMPSNLRPLRWIES